MENQGKLKEKEALRKNRVVGTLDTTPFIEEIDIKEQDKNRVR